MGDAKRRGDFDTRAAAAKARLDALRPETITASPGSAPSTAEDGAHCIALAGFAQTVVCLPESTSAYTLSGNQLSFTLEDRIADVDGSVAMTLTRTL